MWIPFARAPRPDAEYWPGRRSLAFLDAVVWPALLLWMINTAPVGGVVRDVAVIATIIFALRHAHRALLLNQRYRFMTWRLGVIVAVILALGLMAKVMS